ncbi:MAG: glycosyltransferase [Bacteroidota bacterium]
MKKIFITVTNDLETDQRMHKTAITLSENGFVVCLTGRKLPNSKQINRPYQTKRFRFLFNHGFLFYACYNIRLFWFLLFTKWDIVLSCDMDSLPAGYISSKIRGKSVVFDSHELFSEVPEVQDRKFVKSVWRGLENFFIPRLKHVYTVSEHIASYYNNKYGISAQVIRNLPEISSTPEGKIPENISKPFVLYQGALNTGRGIEKLMDAMADLPRLNFVIAGSGPLKKHLHQKRDSLDYKNRIHLTGRLDFKDLAALTKQAWLGVSLEEDKGLNYRFALPNKLFDYLKAGVPVLVSDLPEMRAFVEKTRTGDWVSPDADAKTLSDKINTIWKADEAYKRYAENAKSAIKKYNWEQESLKQLEIFRSI